MMISVCTSAQPVEVRYTTTKTNHTSLAAALLSAVINSKNIVYLLYVLALWREQPPAPLLYVTKINMHKSIHMYVCTYV